MKKLFYFAAAAMMMAACTSEELNVKEAQQAVQDNSAVNFDVYTLRGVTRAGTPGTITTESLKGTPHGQDGFGVFAYYTDSKTYDQNAIPNFMYNQQVTWNATDEKWTYEPVKYWPNEFGDAAKADEIDYVTFFAYAPWTKFQPTTGKPDVTGVADDDVDNWQNKNIVSVKKNSETGDPIIKYVVDTNPATSVDLLWGVNADEDGWAPLDGTVTDAQNEEGKPFINLTKPITPFDADGGKIKFNLRHALAKVKFTIDYIADDNTAYPGENYDPTKAPNLINADQTRIFVRWIEIDGFALKGALNLNNEDANKPLWKSYEDGIKELIFPDAIRFNDGRKDAKEGTENGKAKEENMDLNPEIVENFASTEEEIDDTDPDNPVKTGKIIFGAKKNPGVKPFDKNNDSQLLFAGNNENDGYFYVIPRGEEDGTVKMTINYDVLTLDPNLSTTLSGTKDLGSQISNQIWKENVLGELDFEAGKQYVVKIHLGMTSVKVEAVVEPWTEVTPASEVDLPDNQPDQTTPPTPAPATTFAEQVAAAWGNFVTVTPSSDGSAVTVTGAPTNYEELDALFASLHTAGVTSISMDGYAYDWDSVSSCFLWWETADTSWSLGYNIRVDQEAGRESFKLETSGDLEGTIKFEFD